MIKLSKFVRIVLKNFMRQTTLIGVVEHIVTFIKEMMSICGGAVVRLEKINQVVSSKSMSAKKMMMTKMMKLINNLINLNISKR